MGNPRLFRGEGLRVGPYTPLVHGHHEHVPLAPELRLGLSRERGHELIRELAPGDEIHLEHPGDRLRHPASFALAVLRRERRHSLVVERRVIRRRVRAAHRRRHRASPRLVHNLADEPVRGVEGDPPFDLQGRGEQGREIRSLAPDGHRADHAVAQPLAPDRPGPFAVFALRSCAARGVVSSGGSRFGRGGRVRGGGLRRLQQPCRRPQQLRRRRRRRNPSRDRTPRPRPQCPPRLRGLMAQPRGRRRRRIPRRRRTAQSWA